SMRSGFADPCDDELHWQKILTAQRRDSRSPLSGGPKARAGNVEYSGNADYWSVIEFRSTGPPKAFVATPVCALQPAEPNVCAVWPQPLWTPVSSPTSRGARGRNTDGRTQRRRAPQNLCNQSTPTRLVCSLQCCSDKCLNASIAVQLHP